MLHRLIQSSQPIFSLLLYIIVIPMLWFVFQHPISEGQVLQSVLALIGLIGASFFMGLILEKTELTKNSINASAFALLIAVLFADIKFDHLREIFFMLFATVTVLQSIKIYKEDHPGAQYLILGFLVGIQFLLLPFVGIYSIAGILPYMLFGAGIRIKGIVSYLVGAVISVYLYLSIGYLFDLDSVINFDINLKVYNIFSDTLSWIGPFSLVAIAIFIGIPGNLSLFRDLSVEKRFYQRIMLFHSILILAQGIVLSVTNNTPALNIIATFSVCLFLTVIFTKVQRAWVSSVFFLLALIIFIGRSYFI
tara:strand:+ start:54407 stop:55327 length:921 start_codon:yes stop_codon:yes gene_type:complete